MISEITACRKECSIPTLIKMLPRKQYKYIHYMQKLEDVRKMVGCNGLEGAAVSTW